MKISKSIILPILPDKIKDLDEAKSIMQQIIDAIKEHNLTNYDDEVDFYNQLGKGQPENWDNAFKFAENVSHHASDPTFKTVDGLKIHDRTLMPVSLNEMRNTYVYSMQDSLDADYPFEMDFEIVNEMTVIKKILLSFRIRQFRAYSKGAASNEQQTTSAKSHSHSGQTTESGGSHSHSVTSNSDQTSINEGHWHTYSRTSITTGSGGSHSHSLSISSGGSHSHTVEGHTHEAIYGIYEDTQSPTINVWIDNGSGYGGSPIGEYTTDQLDIDITEYISGKGFKRVKFTTDLRTRISAWTLCKIDIRA